MLMVILPHTLFQNIGSNPLIAMAVLPYLVPDSRCKPELGKILRLAYVCRSSSVFLDLKVLFTGIGPLQLAQPVSTTPHDHRTEIPPRHFWSVKTILFVKFHQKNRRYTY